MSKVVKAKAFQVRFLRQAGPGFSPTILVLSSVVASLACVRAIIDAREMLGEQDSVQDFANQVSRRATVSAMQRVWHHGLAQRA